MSTAEKRPITATEYLALERAAQTKSQLYDGEMFAMTGASREHNVISGNIFRRISEQFDDRPCEVYTSDMRVKVDPSGTYTYPDVVATCESPKFEDDHVDTLVNPQVIIEVLSKSTEGFDRGRKFEDYRLLTSLQHYVLIAQEKYHVERFTRQSDDTWVLWETSDLDSIVSLSAINCEIRLRDVYARIDVDTSE